MAEELEKRIIEYAKWRGLSTPSGEVNFSAALRELAEIGLKVIEGGRNE
jgi:hypothetical protein